MIGASVHFCSFAAARAASKRVHWGREALPSVSRGRGWTKFGGGHG